MAFRGIKFSEFKETLHANGMPFFEVLLKTSQVRGTASIVAYRIYPIQP